MSLFKNEVGRPSNKTIKKRNIFKGICVIFGLIIIGLVGYILNDKGIINLTNKNTKSGNEITTTTNEVVKQEKLSDEEVKKIFDKYNLYTNWLDIFNIEEVSNSYYEKNKDMFDSTFSYFYNADVTNKTISDGMKFAVSMGNLYIKEEVGETAYGEKYTNKVFDFSGNKSLSLEAINQKSIELFGSKINVKNIVDDENNIIVALLDTTFKYNPNTNSIIPGDYGIGDGSSIDYYTKIVDSSVSGNKLEITNKVMFVVCPADDEDYCYVSKTDQDINNIKKTLTTVNKSDIKNIGIDKYINKLDSYKWTFTKNSEGNYVFTSVEKVK